MTPQFVDLNGDGYKDIVAATFMGEAFIVAGGKKGYSQPENIVDRDGDNIRISMYWDNDEGTYLHVRRNAKGEKYVKDHHMTSIAVVDWDEDGDFDLVLGAYEGGLYVCKNEGTKSEPKFATTNNRIQANRKPLKIKGGLATPRICDWNGDGLFDIVCGSSKGGIYLWSNEGEKGEPKFGKEQVLVKSLLGNTSGSIESEEDYFASMMVPMVDGLPVGPGRSLHIETFDYDGDGDLDLIVGGQSMAPAQDKELTTKEKKRLKSLKNELKTLETKLNKFFKGDMDQEAYEELEENEEFVELQDKMGPIYQEMMELEPMPQTIDRVWLYKNKGQKTNTQSK